MDQLFNLIKDCKPVRSEFNKIIRDIACTIAYFCNAEDILNDFDALIDANRGIKDAWDLFFKIQGTCFKIICHTVNLS